MRYTVSSFWRFGCLAAATAVAIIAGLAVYYMLTSPAAALWNSPSLYFHQLAAFIGAWWADRPPYSAFALALIAGAIFFIEKLEFRTWTSHAVAATITSMLLVFTVTDDNILIHGSQIQSVMRCLVASFCAGVVYWALAGRKAGAWPS